ncbi:MAG TPA: substrate-binding domain-containing protein [Methylibium sp.]
MNLTRRLCLAAGLAVLAGRSGAAQVLSIFGDETLQPVLAPLNALFEAAHPGVRIGMRLKPPPAGIDGIVAGVSMLAPLAHDATEGELEPYKRLFGHLPIDVRIGRIGFRAPGRKSPPAVVVHADNPLRSLSMSELARVLTTGQAGGDLRRWNQLGVDAGPWRAHAIHLYGTHDNGGYVTALRASQFGNKPLAAHYEALAQDQDVLDAVSADRYALGIASQGVDDSELGGARMLALSSGALAASTATLDEVRQGRYPLSPFLHIYLPARSRAEIAAPAREYVRLALSRQGQQLIGAGASNPAGLVPLPPHELAAERAKVDEPQARP